MGSATVSAKFPETGKQYDCVLGTFQMCILVLFNSHKELTFRDIKAAMKFDDETCFKNLKSLMFKGYKLLQLKNEKTLG